MMVVQAHWSVLIPWQFRTDDLLSHIGDLLPLNDFRRISMWLLTRQFDKLWKDPALLGMLKHHCAICGEAVSLQYIAVHLRLEHQLGPNDLHLLVMQLCRIFSVEHSDEPHCDHCGELLPTLDVLAFDPVPDMHLPGCPLILHLAAFLMHPVLYKSPYDPVSWPTPQAIESAFQRQEHQRLMFNARNLDTAGQEFDLLISCGLQLLQDATIRDCVAHQCLLCHKFLFLPGKLVNHLLQHDYKQYNTMWCLRRLQQYHQPCVHCGSDSHPPNFVCPALLNLAVFLTNGRRSGQGEFDLEQLAHPGTAPQSRHQRRGGQAKQTSAQKGAQPIYNSLHRHQLENNGSCDGQNYAETGGHDQCPASGVRVHLVPPARGRQFAAHTDQLSQTVAGQRSQSDPAAHDGHHDGGNAEDAARQASTSTGDGRDVPGLCEVQPHQCQSRDAVPEMGCGGSTIGAQQGQSPSDWRGQQHHTEHPPNPQIRAGDHAQISFSDQAPAGGSQSEVDSVPVDCGTSHARGAVEPLANRVISQHLATCEADFEATDATALSSDQATGQDAVDGRIKFLVRVLENDTATMCYVNASMTALTWMTMLCQCVKSSMWTRGYALLRGLCQWNPLPLNLRVFTVDDLSEQQDILEFTTFIIDRNGTEISVLQLVYSISAHHEGVTPTFGQ